MDEDDVISCARIHPINSSASSAPNTPAGAARGIAVTAL
jgi:hypothetical protein